MLTRKSRMMSAIAGTFTLALFGVALTGLTGCQSSSQGPVKAAGKASDHDRALLLDQIKSLEGEWTMPGEDGKPVVASIFTVSSNGSVVREIMFPGSPHEMTNVYHMDGSDLIMTHYCAMGNQPRMRGDATRQGEVALKFDSVTNLSSPEEAYMGDLKIVIKDADHVEQHWTNYKNGKPGTDHNPVFELTRKK